MQQRNDAAKAAQENVEMDMESDSEEEGEARDGRAIDNEVGPPQEDRQRAAYEVTQPAPAAPTGSGVVIREYDPKKGEGVYK